MPIALAIVLLLLPNWLPLPRVTARQGPPTPLPKVTIHEAHFATADGLVDLRGVNLGNWLLIEPWMLGIHDDALPSEYDVDQLLSKRFGDDRAGKLKTIWRDNWITEDDFFQIKAFGYNVVRLPIDHTVIEDPGRPGKLDDDGIRYVDRAIQWAAGHGLYVILDMHGAPGNQSRDAPSGRVDHNRLWTDAAAQDRLVSLWAELAARYAGKTNVAAYDILNEPWGDFNDAHHDAYGPIVDRCVKAIRGSDEATVILVAAQLGGNFDPVRRYLDDRDQSGWTNVALTDHYYPGLFGSEPTLLSHARHDASLDAKAEQYRKWNAPLLVGEMQVVFERLHQPRLMRYYFDRYNDLGWAATAWSWKLIHPSGGVADDNWYSVTNARPWSVDLRHDSFETIAAKFEALGTMPWTRDEEVSKQLRMDRDDLEPLVLPDPQLGPSSVDLVELPSPWKAMAIGPDAGGGATRVEDGLITIAGRGRDIFGSADSFLFVAHSRRGDFEMTTTLTEFIGSGQWSKAGLMIRAGDQPGDPFLLLHAFPSGRVTMAWRSEPGMAASETHLNGEQAVGFPMQLGLRRSDGKLQIGFAKADGPWKWIDAPNDVALAPDAPVGYAVSSNASDRFAIATFRSPPSD